MIHELNSLARKAVRQIFSLKNFLCNFSAFRFYADTNPPYEPLLIIKMAYLLLRLVSMAKLDCGLPNMAQRYYFNF